MDPVQKIYMFNHWLQDQKDQAELAKNHAYLLGSFWDPERVKQILGDGNTHISTDAEFEESCKLIKQRQESKSTRKRKRHRIVK